MVSSPELERAIERYYLRAVEVLDDPEKLSEYGCSYVAVHLQAARVALGILARRTGRG